MRAWPPDSSYTPPDAGHSETSMVPSLKLSRSWPSGRPGARALPVSAAGARPVALLAATGCAVSDDEAVPVVFVLPRLRLWPVAVSPAGLRLCALLLPRDCAVSVAPPRPRDRTLVRLRACAAPVSEAVPSTLALPRPAACAVSVSLAVPRLRAFEIGRAS